METILEIFGNFEEIRILKFILRLRLALIGYMLNNIVESCWKKFEYQEKPNDKF